MPKVNEPVSQMSPAKSPWQCVTCGAGYAEYTNGCPKCWEDGIRSRVEETEVPGPGRWE